MSAKSADIRPNPDNPRQGSRPTIPGAQHSTAPYALSHALYPPLRRKGNGSMLPCVTRGIPPGARMADAESDLLRSSLDLLILKALTWGPMHGYAISEWIGDATATLLLIEEGTLYPALHRLERKGWIAA